MTQKFKHTCAVLEVGTKGYRAMEKNNIIEELKKREEEARQIRRKQADWNYINNQPS
ncbi:hypothetical protein [Thermofilum sp.]|uniref:hypothetical protein n=1 Tax=Thermofilum sp. TaxID=1961369 RepID=UPI00316A7790